MAAAISIDEAASGFLRLRFVNAISASWTVLYAVVAVLLGVATVIVATPQDTSNALIVIGVLAVSLLLIPVAGAVLDLLPSQLIGFIGLLASFVLVALGLIICVQALSTQLGRDSMTDYEAVQNWIGVSVVGLSLPVFAEGLGWSWWQLRASREEFHAARGWRPPARRIFSALRARMGLPAYVSNFGRGRAGLSVVYFLIAVLNLGLVALIFAPVIASYIPRDNKILTPYFIVGGFLALPLLNIFGAGAFLERIASRQATKLYQDARDWDARPPIVFLRAFDQDVLRLKVRTRDPVAKLPAGCGAARTIDEILLELGSPYGPLIAIGDPRNPVPPLGAARIYVPEQGSGWQHVVSSLVQSANVVVMCPNASEGVKWELELLEQSAGRVRIIYIANPEASSADNAAMFARLGEMPELRGRQQPIAAFRHPKAGWTVLTTSKPPSVQTYSVAINTALQALLGMQGTPLRVAGGTANARPRDD